MGFPSSLFLSMQTMRREICVPNFAVFRPQVRWRETPGALRYRDPDAGSDEESDDEQSSDGEALLPPGLDPDELELPGPAATAGPRRRLGAAMTAELVGSTAEDPAQRAHRGTRKAPWRQRGVMAAQLLAAALFFQTIAFLVRL